MNIIFILIPISVLIATGFLFAFIWAVKSGQYEDTCTPAMRLLADDPVSRPADATAPRPAGGSIAKQPPAAAGAFSANDPLPRSPGAGPPARPSLSQNHPPDHP